MTKTRVIRVFSFIMALTLVFAMCSAPSYAISPRQFGAWIASALTALNITYQSTVLPAASFLDYIGDPFQITNNIVEHVTLTNPRDEIEQYLKQSTISFNDDYIEIDGKHYQDIWLSNEAAEKFRVNAFDIKSAFDIASNSNGTYVSGAGKSGNTPIFNVNGQLISQTVQVPASAGSYSIPRANINVFKPEGSNSFRYNVYYDDGEYSLDNSPGNYSYPISYRLLINSYNEILQDNYVYSTKFNNRHTFQRQYVAEPFDFDWVSGTIPADEQLAPTDGLHIYVPVEPSEWSDSPNTQTIINNYNTYIENNPDISPDVDLDLNRPGLLDKIGDLLDILGPIIDLMKPSFGPKNQDPTPPIPPEPTGNTISETPWESLVQWLQRILNKLDDILGIRDILNNFKSDFNSAISTITQWLSQIKSILDSILNALSDLADTILNGNADWFSDIVDAIKRPFLKWLNIFKAGVSIWHYVIEWLQNISAPFSFFWNILSSSYSIYLSPFYAVASACIVIAIYRRFGR